MPRHRRKLLTSYGPTTYEALKDNDLPRRPAWGRLLYENTSILIAMVLGTISCSSVIAYTAWLSRQFLKCPSWAIDCTVTQFVTWRL